MSLRVEKHPALAELTFVRHTRGSAAAVPALVIVLNRRLSHKRKAREVCGLHFAGKLPCLRKGKPFTAGHT